MELSVAKDLIKNGVSISNKSQLWADLGAGNGLFTKAVADYLPPDSTIFAIDLDASALQRIRVSHTVMLGLRVADIQALPPDLPLLDGIVMANSLHYIRDQVAFLNSLKKNHLKPGGHLIIVEYDLQKANPWVPYPISKQKLNELAAVCAYDLSVLGESVKSKLNSSEIYAAVLKPYT